MLVGGVDRVFEIGRVFRNEGLSRRHNPEFTMLEVYQAYSDFRGMMTLIYDLVQHLCNTVIGKTRIKCQDSDEVGPPPGLPARPDHVVKVDDERVLVFQRHVLVRMTVRLRSLPTVMVVPVVFVVDMGVFVLHRVVPVLELRGIVGRPQN